MFAPVSKMNAASPVSDISGWVSAYKEAFVEHQHDLSQLTLVLPDDCLIVVGPPRLGACLWGQRLSSRGIHQ